MCSKNKGREDYGRQVYAVVVLSALGGVSRCSALHLINPFFFFFVCFFAVVGVYHHSLWSVVRHIRERFRCDSGALCECTGGFVSSAPKYAFDSRVYIYVLAFRPWQMRDVFWGYAAIGLYLLVFGKCTMHISLGTQ